MNDNVALPSQAAFEWATTLPWLIVLAFAVPLLIAAWCGVYPTRRWLYLLSLSLLLSIITVFVPPLLTAVLVLDALVLLVAWIDAAVLFTMTRSGIHVHREMPRTCSIGVPITTRLTLENRTSVSLLGAVKDDLPEHCVSEPDHHALRLPPRSELTVQQRLTPYRRGVFTVDNVYLRLSSPLRFWVRHRIIPLADRLNVYPDMKQMSDYALLARTNRLSLIGVRRTRRIGQDSDFERLRDYTRDDHYRHIDWRSTARRNKLTVKQFQTDQSQRVIFMLDCGRMMTNQHNGLSLLDHALNASLMMAYVALHQGDAVGMLCFSDTIHSFLPPRGGPSQMNRLIQAGFDQFPRMVESRYDQAFLYLKNHCKRRSLVTLSTNVIDEVNAAAVVDYLGNLSGHHLALGVLLRDRVLFEAAETPLLATEDHLRQGDRYAGVDVATRVSRRTKYRAAAAADILIWRHQVISDLQHRGVLCVDAFPDELTAPLVNQYLKIKAQHLL